MLGLSTSTKALAIASSLKEKKDKDYFYLTSTYGEAEGLISDLISILGEELSIHFW